MTSDPQRIIFRVDASAKIAGGHLSRCLTLADTLRSKGLDTVFLCRDLPSTFLDIMLDRGHEFVALAFDPPKGMPWEEDASEVRDYILSLPKQPEWLIVDHYTFDRWWEETLQPFVKRIMVIDDLGTKQHNCDLLLNHGLLPSIDTTYRELVPCETELLLGPKFTLLGPDYAKAHIYGHEPVDTISRVLISYGNADETNETAKALSALQGFDVHIDVVVGGINRHLSKLEQQVAKIPHATLHIQVPSLAPLMAKAHVAFCAGGNTIYELLAAGVPIVTTTTAENQIPAMRNLADAGMVNWLGYAEDVSIGALQAQYEKIQGQPAVYIEQVRKGRAMVDGRGVERVVAAMEQQSQSTTFRLGEYTIGLNSAPFVIAEMSGNHNQSIERAFDIVRAAAKAGANAVKLQTYTADTMTLDLHDNEFMIDDEKSLWKGNSLYELYQKAYTPWEWHAPIMQLARELGIICFSSPFDESAVDFLETLNVPCYKIASFENNHIPLIRKVASTRKPIIVSTGMATVEEIHDAVDTIRNNGGGHIVLLKCTSSYPADPNDSNVRTLPDLRSRFRCEVGLSDHTMGTGAACAAVANGASVVEKHFTLCRADGGVDSAFSLEPDELKTLVTETERARRSLGELTYGPSKVEDVSGRRSLYIATDMKAGDIFTTENLRCVRPGLGLAPKYYDELLGRTVNQSVKKGTPLNWEHVEKV